MRFVVFDTESDNLAYQATKLHVLGWKEGNEEVQTTFCYGTMREVFSREDCFFVGHNVIRHDLPLINRILGLDLKYTQFVDTLALSWYLCFNRSSHGLADWGETVGVPKPKIDDWQNLTPDEYAHRVTEDVKINYLVWKHLEKKLGTLYGWKK